MMRKILLIHPELVFELHVVLESARALLAAISTSCPKCSLRELHIHVRPYADEQLLTSASQCLKGGVFGALMAWFQTYMYFVCLFGECKNCGE